MTVIIDTCCVVTFAAVNVEILPVPDADKPVFKLLFVQLIMAPTGKLLKLIAEIAPPEHTVWFEGIITEGVGFTVILNVLAAEEQPLKVGVTVNMETSCAATFAAVIAAILPAPDANKPVFVLLFVQLNVAPTGVEVNVVAAINVPPHTVWLMGTMSTIGFGLTVIVKFEGVPTQLFTVGVTVIVDTCCVEILAAVKAEILPLAEAIKPVAVLLFIHEKEPPTGVLTKLIAATDAPEQAVLLATEITEGVGFTVIKISCIGRQLAPKSGFKIA